MFKNLVKFEVLFFSYKNGIMQLVGAIRESADEVLSRRKAVTFSPRDTNKVQQFEKEGKLKGKVYSSCLSMRSFFIIGMWFRVDWRSLCRILNNRGNNEAPCTQMKK